MRTDVRAQIAAAACNKYFHNSIRKDYFLYFKTVAM